MKNNELTIGRRYYFDSVKKEYGVYLGMTEGSHIFSNEYNPDGYYLTESDTIAFTDPNNFILHEKQDKVLSNATYQYGQWISVKDRLPETNKAFKESDYVLCWNQTTHEQVVCWYNSKTNKWFVGTSLCNNDIIQAESITHWMPLPEPPKQ